jgi:hypothetical protein
LFSLCKLTSNIGNENSSAGCGETERHGVYMYESLLVENKHAHTSRSNKHLSRLFAAHHISRWHTSHLCTPAYLPATRSPAQHTTSGIINLFTRSINLKTTEHDVKYGHVEIYRIGKVDPRTSTCPIDPRATQRLVFDFEHMRIICRLSFSRFYFGLRYGRTTARSGTCGRPAVRRGC